MRILFVCLGNICRSPTAEGIMRGLVREAGAQITVDSAGTSGWHDGKPPDPRSMAEARRRGLDISAQRSRRVVPEDFTRFDLILGMDQSNLHNLEAMAPKDAPARLGLLLEYLPDHPARDVPDPYYEDGFDGVYDLIEAACKQLLHDVRQG